MCIGEGSENMIHGEYITLGTGGYSDVRNITDRVADIVREAGIINGQVLVFSPGSTASVTTLEYEVLLVEDFKAMTENMIPEDIPSKHTDTFADRNGFAHLRATLFGPGVTVPIHNGQMVLGKWQHIVVIDHDNRPRERSLFVQVSGE